LTPSATLSANEIAAAALADQGGTFNPQQQYPVRWPAEPVVARAYMDQLRRAGALHPSLDQRLKGTLAAAQVALDARTRSRSVAQQLRLISADVKAEPADSVRRRALSDVLKDIAERID